MTMTRMQRLSVYPNFRMFSLPSQTPSLIRLQQGRAEARALNPDGHPNHFLFRADEIFNHFNVLRITRSMSLLPRTKPITMLPLGRAYPRFCLARRPQEAYPSEIPGQIG